jgi:putative FmdB family regulatory protein
MPTYEYVCITCNHAFEVFQPMTDPPLQVCPKELCPRIPWGKGRVKRLIGTGAGLLFKGSGFYTTDYRSESYKSAAKQETAPAKTPPGDKCSPSKSGEKAPPQKSSSSSSA